MALSLDLLNAQLADLRGPIQNTFSRALYFDDALRARAQSWPGGSLIERLLAYRAPAVGRAIRTGDETMAMDRKDVIKKVRLDLSRVGISVAIPQRELDRAANTKLTAIKFLQDYPALTTEKIRQNLEEFHLTGQVFSPDPVLDSTALDGFMCLNGQFVSSAGVTGTSNGVLDFIDPASQTDVVQDLAKSKAYGYYNQYKQISSWSADGEDTWRAMYRTLQAQGDNAEPDLIMVDDAQFANYQRNKRDLIRLSVVQDPLDKAGASSLVETFYKAKVVAVPISLDLTKFTGPAADGVAYWINTRFWTKYVLRDFSWTPFTRMVANQDVVSSMAVAEYNYMCDRVRAQGCTSGGAI